MLNLDKVEYGLFPFGSLSGIPVFHFGYSVDSKKYQSEDEMSDAANEIMETILAKISDMDCEERWSEALLGQKYCVFSGKDIMVGDEAKVANAVFNSLSRLSYEVQKETPAYKLHPIPMCYLGVPEHFTGKDQWYENFNLLFIECPVTVGGKIITKDTLPTNDMALVEMQNMSFAQCYAKVGSIEEVNAFIDCYVNREDLSLDKSRCGVIVDMSVDVDIIKYCAEVGLRVFPRFPNIDCVINV